MIKNDKQKNDSEMNKFFHSGKNSTEVINGERERKGKPAVPG